MRRIIVGADFSPTSAAANEHAIHLARVSGAEIVFVHVTSSSSGEERDTARIELAKLRERATAMDVSAASRIVGDHPDEALAEAAADLDADLVIVGSHGRTGFERFLMGSVAERTTRLAECDVMVARGTDPFNGYSRILVPTDFSTAADRALELALRVATQPANVHLFHCWKAPASVIKTPEAKLAEEAEKIGAEATRRAASLVERHPTGRAELTFETRRGPAAQTIREKLDEDIWDLVVMGSHGRRGVRRFLLGSVAEQTARHANCSVLITHPRSA